MTINRRCLGCDAPLDPTRRSLCCTPACRTKAWQAANPERTKANARAYRERNRERINARLNRDRARKREAAQRNAPPRDCARCGGRLPQGTSLAKKYCSIECRTQVARASTRAWQDANREKVRAKNRAWNRAHPEKMREIRERFEARRRAARTAALK